MIKEIINQYEYDTDYEFVINTIDDIKDEDVKEEIQELYESIDEFKIQKEIMDNQFKVYNKQNKKGIHLLILSLFVIITKLNALGMIGKCNNL